MAAIRSATADDLAKVLDWLEREYYADHKTGFWCNRDIIERAQRSGELHVLVEDSEPVALYVGTDHTMDILSVRQDKQKKGYGKALAEFALEQVRASDACYVRIECSPRTSIEFWKRMGFKLFRPDDPDCHRGYMLFEKEYRVPAGPREHVVIRLFPELANHYPDIRPLREWNPIAVRDKSGVIILGQRIIFFQPEHPRSHDSVAEVIVNGKSLAKDKLKRDELAYHGVERGPCSTFYMDFVRNA